MSRLFDPSAGRFLPPAEGGGFKAFMAAVDTILLRTAGVSSDDLPDVCYRDLFDDDATPAQAAAAALEGA